MSIKFLKKRHLTALVVMVTKRLYNTFRKILNDEKIVKAISKA